MFLLEKPSLVFTCIGGIICYFILDHVNKLNILQDVLDTECWIPSIIGNFHTSLPRTSILKNNWYRITRPFNQYSLLLYEFLCHSELSVANLAFNQTVNYKNFKSNTTSYIDYCFVLQDRVTTDFCQV